MRARAAGVLVLAALSASSAWACASAGGSANDRAARDAATWYCSKQATLAAGAVVSDETNEARPAGGAIYNSSFAKTWQATSIACITAAAAP